MNEQAKAKVVGLLGISGSGKSIVARRLTEHHGYSRLRFGDPVRDMLRAGFGLTEDEIDGRLNGVPQARFGGYTPSNLRQTLSHDWGRGRVHSDLFVHEWERRLTGLQGFVISDDIQRANEALAVRGAGGIIVRITRPGHAPKDQGTFRQQAAIVHDIELVNHSQAALAELADAFASRLGELLSI